MNQREKFKENGRKVGSINAAKQKAKTHCPHGHPYAGENLYIDAYGSRQCLACRKERNARNGQIAKEKRARLRLSRWV